MSRQPTPDLRDLFTEAHDLPELISMLLMYLAGLRHRGCAISVDDLEELIEAISAGRDSVLGGQDD